MGPNTIKYAKKVVLKKNNKKKSLLNINIKKDIKNLFKVLIEHFIEFIVSCT